MAERKRPVTENINGKEVTPAWVAAFNNIANKMISLGASTRTRHDLNYSLITELEDAKRVQQRYYKQRQSDATGINLLRVSIHDDALKLMREVIADISMQAETFPAPALALLRQWQERMSALVLDKTAPGQELPAQMAEQLSPVQLSVSRVKVLLEALEASTNVYQLLIPVYKEKYKLVNSNKWLSDYYQSYEEDHLSGKEPAPADVMKQMLDSEKVNSRLRVLLLVKLLAAQPHLETLARITERKQDAWLAKLQTMKKKDFRPGPEDEPGKTAFLHSITLFCLYDNRKRAYGIIWRLLSGDVQNYYVQNAKTPAEREFRKQHRLIREHMICHLHADGRKLVQREDE